MTRTLHIGESCEGRDLHAARRTRFGVTLPDNLPLSTVSDLETALCARLPVVDRDAALPCLTSDTFYRLRSVLASCVPDRRVTPATSIADVRSGLAVSWVFADEIASLQAQARARDVGGNGAPSVGAAVSLAAAAAIGGVFGDATLSLIGFLALPAMLWWFHTSPGDGLPATVGGLVRLLAHDHLVAYMRRHGRVRRADVSAALHDLLYRLSDTSAPFDANTKLIRA